ncbi:MAG: hypothetical protein H5T96_09675, partial [Tissierellales bacterium]|nr:hypothetical protein [Tissierellales bacterium]
VGMSQGGRYNIDTSDKKGQINMGNLLLMMAQDADRGNGGLDKVEGFSAEQARKIAPKVTNAFIEVVEGTEFNPEPTYRYSITGGEEGTIEFNLTQQQKLDYQGNQFEPSENVSAIRDYQYQIMKTGTGTTAYDGGETNLYNAYIDRSEFPNTHYGISGNLEQVNDRRGQTKYQFRLNIYDPIEKIWHQNIGFPPEGYISEEKVNSNKLAITDELLYQLLKGDLDGYTPQYQKELEKASKNPF